MMTIILIAINLFISIRAFSAFKKGYNIEKYMLIPHEVAAGRNFIGVVQSHFSHADVSHLVFNMLTLYFFAPSVERELGAVLLLILYALSGLGSTLLVYIFHHGNPDYRALGASGSVSGVIFASIVIDPYISIYFLFLPIPIPGPIFAIGYIVLSTYLMRRQLGNVAHEGHIGGALAGLVLAGVLAPQGFIPLFERILALIS